MMLWRHYTLTQKLGIGLALLVVAAIFLLVWKQFSLYLGVDGTIDIQPVAVPDEEEDFETIAQSMYESLTAASSSTDEVELGEAHSVASLLEDALPAESDLSEADWEAVTSAITNTD